MSLNHYKIALSLLLLSIYATIYSQNMESWYSPFRNTDLLNRFDSLQVDFSAEFRNWLNFPHQGVKITERTHDIQNYEFDTDTIFGSVIRIYDQKNRYITRPINGVLGNDYQRIQISFTPGIKQDTSLLFQINGNTKTQKASCNFTGYIKIQKIVTVTEANSPTYSLMIGEYIFREDPKQAGSGIFKGTCCYYILIDDKNKKITLDDEDGVSDGYYNKTHVGTWESYKRRTIKKCIWGDGRLPYTFNFDIGDGELIVNPVYRQNGWTDSE